MGSLGGGLGGGHLGVVIQKKTQSYELSKPELSCIRYPCGLNDGFYPVMQKI